jgi:hypothetical protein
MVITRVTKLDLRVISQALKVLGFVWFVAKCATICLRLVVCIEELTLD